MLSVEMERDMAPGDDAACCILEDLIEWRTQRLQQIALQHKARAEEHSSRLSILGLTLSCHDNELLALNAVEAGALGERPRLGLGEAVRVDRSQPIRRFVLPVKVRSRELAAYPRSHSRRRVGVIRLAKAR